MGQMWAPRLTALAFAVLASTCHAWEIEGAQLLSHGELTQAIGGLSEPNEVGAAIYGAYRRAGFLSVEVHVETNTQRVSIKELPVRPVGGYSAYLASGDVLTAEAVALASARIGMAARLNGESVKLAVQPAGDDGVAEVRADGDRVPGAPMRGGNLIFSTLGQRYSGPDVLTAYGWANIGDAQQLDASVSHAFSDWREDSKDGRFGNLTAGYRKASPWGLTSLQLMQSDYKTGGTAAALDVGGAISRINLEHAYLFSPHLTGTARLSYVDNEQEFGELDWSDRERFTSLTLSARYVGHRPGYVFVLDGGVEQGLGGSRKISHYPLMGEFDSKFTMGTLRGEVNTRFDSGWGLTAKGGFQSADKGTPSASQFYLGGPDRGRSYNTGYTSMPRGIYASLVGLAPAIRGVGFYAGLDYARGKPVVGEARIARSGFVGATYRLNSQLSIDASYARALGRLDDPSGKRTRWNLTASLTL